ncbi:DUF3078 domain-containing protein [Dysgonomonas massiliensis]|uniref:DUF3078 domain-containing protein n=1 Tax=Dysgonomonas massiliensis TaxID=2040292 RepID=UPI000C782924|nr:DUF3078 domain-containing protein [Dysgonomonas massiliensis]
MKIKYASHFFTIIIVCLFSLPSYGQNIERQKNDSILERMTDIDTNIKEYIKIDTVGGIAFRHMVDSLLNEISYKAPRDANGLLIAPKDNWVPFDNYMSFRDTVIFDPAFLPIVFDGKIIPDNLSFLSGDSIYQKKDTKPSFRLIDPSASVAKYYEKAIDVNNRRRSYYMNNPESVQLNAFEFAEHPIIKENTMKKVSIFDKLLKTDDPITLSSPSLEKLAVKTSKWKIVGDHNLSASFNHISGNWNGGGNSSYGATSRQVLNIDYKHNRLSVKNTIEWRLRMQKLKGAGDENEKRDYEINEDYLRLETTMGYDAFDKWAYSLKINAKTPLFNAYKNTNSNYRVRAFLSPFDFDIGPGMSYSLEKKSSNDKYRNLKLALDIQPFIFKYRSIRSDAVNYKDYGMEATVTENDFGIVERIKSYKWERGTQVQLKSTINFNRFCSWDSRMQYFSNYSYTMFEWENILKYSLNRYLGVILMPYYRFDDETVAKKSRNHSYHQLRFSLEFGVQFKW